MYISQKNGGVLQFELEGGQVHQLPETSVDDEVFKLPDILTYYADCEIYKVRLEYINL